MIQVTFPGYTRYRTSPSMSTTANVAGTFVQGATMHYSYKEGEWYVLQLPHYIHESVVQEIETPSWVKQVPYIPQWGYGADIKNSDCGQSCVKMMLAGRGLTLDVPIDTLSKLVGAPAGWTTATHLVTLLEMFGVPAFSDTVIRHYPAIALVTYGRMPARNKQDLKFKDGHWIVLLGKRETEIVYHDPNFRGAGGAFLTLAEEEFNAASQGRFVMCKEP